MNKAAPYIANYSLTRLTLTLAGTEYSQALTSSRPLLIRCSLDDLSSTARVSLTSLGSGTGKMIFQGSEWYTPGFQVGQKTIYAQSPNAGAVLVIETWEAP